MLNADDSLERFLFWSRALGTYVDRQPAAVLFLSSRASISRYVVELPSDLDSIRDYDSFYRSDEETCVAAAGAGVARSTSRSPLGGTLTLSCFSSGPWAAAGYRLRYLPPASAQAFVAAGRWLSSFVSPPMTQKKRGRSPWLSSDPAHFQTAADGAPPCELLRHRKEALTWLRRRRPCFAAVAASAPRRDPCGCARQRHASTAIEGWTGVGWRTWRLSEEQQKSNKNEEGRRKWEEVDDQHFLCSAFPPPLSLSLSLGRIQSTPYPSTDVSITSHHRARLLFVVSPQTIPVFI